MCPLLEADEIHKQIVLRNVMLSHVKITLSIFNVVICWIIKIITPANKYAFICFSYGTVASLFPIRDVDVRQSLSVWFFSPSV